MRVAGAIRVDSLHLETGNRSRAAVGHADKAAMRAGTDDDALSPGAMLGKQSDRDGLGIARAGDFRASLVLQLSQVVRARTLSRIRRGMSAITGVGSKTKGMSAGSVSIQSASTSRLPG